METAIRWSPSSTTAEQRFLSVDVVGKSFRLCRVTSAKDKKNLQYDVLSTHTKVPAFRAFDWSPANESLIAVGQSSGEATLLRMNDEQNSQESYSFPVRNQRYCNAVAFSAHGLLAAGLDRVRNDFCLNIWDINQRLMLGGPSSSSTSAGAGSTSFSSSFSNKGFAEPLRKLASSEPITSIKFFKDQPATLVTGVKGQFVRIYDLREAPGNASLQFPTRCVHNLAIDSLDENYIASCQTSKDPTICVWDRRVGTQFTSPSLGPITPEPGQSGAALEFRDVVDPKATIWSMRFSKTKRGCLGVLSNTGHFKSYDIAKEYLSDEYRSSMDETLGQGSHRNYPEQIYTKHIRDVCSPYNHPSRGCNESERVVSFDFLNMNVANEPSALTLAGNGQVGIATMQPPSPPVQLSSQCVLARGSPHGGSDFQAMYPSSCRGSKISDVVDNIRQRALPSTSTTVPATQKKNGSKGKNSNKDEQAAQPLSSRESRERALSVGTLGGDRLSTEDALTLLSVNRFRCKEGYLFDGKKNKQIVADDPHLQSFWDWMERSRTDSNNDSMIVNDFDMNYVGVYDVWNNDLGKSVENRRIGPHNAYGKVDISEIIVALANELHLPEAQGCGTDYPEHRRLCLRLCGAAQSQRDLEETVKELVAEKQYTKAAALALFQRADKLAYSTLRGNEPTQAHKLLAMAIAGATKGGMDPDWEETCAEIAKELVDPYARAILAYVSRSDWELALDEMTLPLQYRVEIALRWLPDAYLTKYLNKTTTEAIRQGDIEGVVLTGLGHSAMDLFQSYINKFNDIQTPVLAMSHTVPRFIDNERNKTQFESWRETYRWQINSWKLQLERAKLDVGSRKFAVTWDGRRLISPPPQQVSLTCNYCARPLAQQQDKTSQPSPPTTTGETLHPTTGNPLSSIAMSGTVCPKCGRHMPRCGVCTLWLGSPDPMSRAGTAADAAAQEAQQGGGGGGNRKPKPSEIEIMRRFAVFCINCNHGFHAHHARDWFLRHRVCPVAECDCFCDR